MHGNKVGATSDPKRWTPEAISPLQEAAEAFLVHEFESKSFENSECVFILTSLPTSGVASGLPREARHRHVERHDSRGGPPRDDDW